MSNEFNEAKNDASLRVGLFRDEDNNFVSTVFEAEQGSDEVIKEAKSRLNAAGELKNPDEDRFGTAGKHTARHTENATGWRPGSLPSKGPDPQGIRDFKGDEFQGIIGYARKDPDGLRRPAWWSHFVKEDKTDPNRKLRDEQGNVIPGTPIESIDDLPDVPVLKVCLAEEFPDFLKNNPSIERTADAWGRNPKTGRVNKPEDEAKKVHPRLEEQIRKFAETSEKSGLKIELVDDPNDAHITVMAWERNTPPRLLGFASFPESMNSWSRLRGLGQPRGDGFAFLSNDYAKDKSVSDEELRDLFLHESARGHNMGGCHPHDLGMLNMSQSEAHASTLMAYSNIHGKDIEGVEGSDLGYVDYGIRNWIPNPPKLNTEDGKTIDLQAHLDASYEHNKNKSSTRRSGLLPGASIINHGTNTVLHGTRGDDLIDTNVGYCSVVDSPDPNIKQKVMLAEGHIAKVRGISGNNTIIPAEQGDQVIEPGLGDSKICFYNQSIGGSKKIYSQGNDTLVLSETILHRYGGELKATENALGEIVIGGEDDTITLAGNGVSNIHVIDSLGKTIVDQNVKGLNADQINAQVLTKAFNELRNRDDHSHDHGNKGFAARVENERATAAKEGGRGAA